MFITKKYLYSNLQRLFSGRYDLSQAGNKKRLAHQIIENTLLTITQHAFSHAIRLIGNLILTRLLFPEAFGLVALVITLSSGLSLISDFGITPSIVHSKKGYDPTFLMTAWTVKIMRGAVLFILGCLLAYPLSLLYEQSALAYMIPVFMLSEFFIGFRSITCSLMTKDMRSGPLVLGELFAQVLSLSLTITLAYHYRSPWALVIGSVLGAIIKLIYSFTYIRGLKHFFCWDAESRKDLMQFGRWILISTILTYFITQGDKIVIGKLFTLKELGIYTIAYNFASAFSSIVEILAKKVLLPAYVQITHLTPLEFKQKMAKVKIGFLSASLAPIVFLFVGGPFLIELLYDPRYYAAGGMLRLLALSAIAITLCSMLRVVLLAKGNSHRHMWTKLVELIAMALGLFIGAHLGGLNGLILGHVTAQFISYPICVIAAYRYNAWNPFIELGYIALCALLCSLGLYLL